MKIDSRLVRLPLAAASLGLVLIVSSPANPTPSSESRTAASAHSTKLVDCLGCNGSTTKAKSYSDPTTGNFITISAQLNDGQCFFYSGDCVGTSCTADVTREWKLPQGTQLGFCKSVNGGTYECRDPKPTAQSNNAESNVESDVQISCTRADGESGNIQFKLEAVVTPPGMSRVTVVATCKFCENH